MKFKIISPLLATAMLFSALSMAQTTSGTPQESAKKDPLAFLKVAASIASNAQHQDLNDFLAVYIDSQTWAAALKDGDLGPFLKLKEEKPGRSAVLFFSPAKDIAISVFFDGDAAFGMTSAKAKNSKISG